MEREPSYGRNRFQTLNFGGICGGIIFLLSLEPTNRPEDDTQVDLHTCRGIWTLAAGLGTVQGNPWKRPGEDNRRGRRLQNDLTRPVTPKGSAD